MGGGHFVPAHVDDPSSLLDGCPKWPHISWLCFIQHSLGPIEAIFKKYFWKFWKIEKKEIYFPTPKGPPFGKKIEKLKKIWFFQKKSIFLHLNLNSTCSKLSFEVHNIGIAQNFQIFNFLPINFSSMTNFIRWPLAANIVLKRDCFWYQWTAKDQNIYLWSSLTIHVAF